MLWLWVCPKPNSAQNLTTTNPPVVEVGLCCGDAFYYQAMGNWWDKIDLNKDKYRAFLERMKKTTGGTMALRLLPRLRQHGSYEALSQENNHKHQLFLIN